MKTSLTLAILVFSTELLAQFPNYNAIAVTGDAEIKVVPDQVVLSLGVESRDAGLAVAKGKNDVAVKKVLAVFRQFAIDPSDVQTDFISVDIRYETSAPAIVSHYVVEKTIALTLKNVARFEEELSAALEAGANHIYDVEFKTTELRKYRDQARALAGKAAIEKANDLAAAAGLKVVGKPAGISSYSYGGGSWYGRYRGWHSSTQPQNVYQSGGAGASQGTISLGKISVTATVSMNFHIE